MGITIELSDAAKSTCQEVDQAYGARPLEELSIQNRRQAGRGNTEGNIKEGDHVRIELENDVLIFNK